MGAADFPICCMMAEPNNRNENNMRMDISHLILVLSSISGMVCQMRVLKGVLGI
jgi:hypothetical protein